LTLSHRIKLTLYARNAPPKVGLAIMSIENNKYSLANVKNGATAMPDIKGERLTIGTISVLRTLVELDQAGAIDLPVDDFVTEQREKGDPNELAEPLIQPPYPFDGFLRHK
jgi:hypothetical protein